MIKDSNKIAIIAGERNITYSELLLQINVYAKETPATPGARTIIFADNCVGWIYAFYSIWNNKGIAVPVDASSTVSDLSYIVNDCQPSCIWTSRKKLDIVNDAVKEVGIEVDIKLIEDFETAENDGKKAEFKFDEQDTALIIYTSGTTGSPKGVMLSYQNILANVAEVTVKVPIITAESSTLILLPLHHVLPLVGTVVMPLHAGGTVTICTSMAGPDIMEALQRGKVSIMIGVPRLWQTLYGGIKKKIDASPITRALFALCAKVNNVKFSRFVFKAVHNKMGGHIRYFISGGAALDREIALGLQTLGLELLEGYGMTEAAPMIAFTRPGDLIPNCVGLPLSVTECKIIDGEVCAKGPNIMQGYYNRPEETAAVIDKDGYLHTGDLGRIDEKGRIYITGRSKEIIVLSNGKNVQPNEIEYKLEKYTSRVKEAAVVQDGDLLRAIIVPQKEWAAELTNAEVEETLKREVLEPYNLTVSNYKKLKSLYVYRDDLPRTKLEKLQRFKLKDIIANKTKVTEDAAPIDEPKFEEYQIIKNYIKTEKQISIRPTDHIETDLAFDSLDMVALQGFIEQTFGTKVNAATMPSYQNMLSMAEYVATQKTHIEVEDVDWNTFLNSTNAELELPSASWMTTFLTNLSYCLLKVYNRFSIKGVENIPSSGPFIIAPNHQSFMDGNIVATGFTKEVLHSTYFYATEKHVQGSFRRWFARNNNIILMERGNLRNSIHKLAEVLKQGKNIVIFPEGARTKTGALGNFKKTFAILSKELNVPIVPASITGAYEALPRGTHFVKPHKICLEFLPPVMPDATMSYEDIKDEVKQSIYESMENSANK